MTTLETLHFLIGMALGCGIGPSLVEREWPLVLLFGSFAVINVGMQLLGM